MLVYQSVGGGFQTLFMFTPICAMVKSRCIGDGHPTFKRNPYNGYINPYYWVDDHPLTQGTNGSLDPSTFGEDFQLFMLVWGRCFLDFRS